MWLFPSRREVGVGVFARVEGAHEPSADVTVAIMITGDNEQVPTVQSGGVQECVEKFSGYLVFACLARVGDVSGRENEVSFTSFLAISRDRSGQRAQYHVAVVAVALAQVKVGDVKPAGPHWQLLISPEPCIQNLFIGIETTWTSLHATIPTRPRAWVGRSPPGILPECGRFLGIAREVRSLVLEPRVYAIADPRNIPNIEHRSCRILRYERTRALTV
jgi:hypothetical protein